MLIYPKLENKIQIQEIAGSCQLYFNHIQRHFVSDLCQTWIWCAFPSVYAMSTPAIYLPLACDALQGFWGSDRFVYDEGLRPNFVHEKGARVNVYTRRRISIKFLSYVDNLFSSAG